MKKWALITGASSGIGKAFIPYFLQDGYSLIIVARDMERLDAVLVELEGHTSDIVKIEADLSDPDSVDSLIEIITQKGIVLEALVNNAGVGDGDFFVESEYSRLRDMVDVNIQAVVRLTHNFAPKMVDRGSGMILNVASTAAFQPGPGMNVYYATKAFVLRFSQALTYELKDTGVTVTVLCPGPTQTSFKEKANMTKSKLSLPSPDQVASYGYRAMKKGRRVAIHGMQNRCLVFLSWLLPTGWIMKVIERSNT